MPSTFNTRDRSHWRVRAEELKDWKETLWLYMGGYGPWRRPYPSSKNSVKVRGRTVTDPERVKVVLLVTRKRLQDPGNWGSNSKAILDALVTLGWLVDDDAKWLNLLGSTEDKHSKISTFLSMQIDRQSHSV